MKLPDIKKITVFIVSVGIVFLSCGILDRNEVYSANVPIYGDADNSGILTSADAAMILQKVLRNDFRTGLENTDANWQEYLDVDDNGILTASDASTVLQKVLNDSFKMPAEEEENMNIPQTGYTKSVPQEYNIPSDKGGTVEQFTYSSADYTKDGAEIQKTAYVYLPYGYDPEDATTKYNILYLMHGWGGSAGEYFTVGNGMIKNMLDRMIKNKEISPMIVVSPSFYTDNDSRDFGSSVSALRQFHNDFREHLMPAVEEKYHTYADSASYEDLAKSRDHRAFGGFSLGSVTTWNEFCYDYDYVKYYLPMSGACWYYGGYGDYYPEETCDFFEELIADNHLDQRGYFIYAATGTNDAVRDQVYLQMDEMLSRNNVFTSDKVVFYQKEGGVHDFNAVREYMYNALPMFFQEEKDISDIEYFNVNTPVSQVINDPAFGDFGRLIFPVDIGYYSGNTLGDLKLTWYNNIDPDKTVEIVNYMKEHALKGDTVFYDIYSDEEKAADPEKANTGLFFFKGNKNARTAICNAGGGFAYVGAMHDSFPHALELSKKGYNAFALIYRPGWDTANEDLARAITFIFDHAEELEVDTQCYSVWGGSAGARMAADMGTYGPGYFGGDELPKPGTVIMQYTGHTQYSPNDPPTYACVGTNDSIANWRTMQNRLEAMSALGIPTEFHVYEGLNHGFGLGTGTVAEGWIDDAVAFWEKQMKD